jgi:predicted DNA-binding protein
MAKDPRNTPAKPEQPILVFEEWEGIVVDGEFYVRDVCLAKKLGFNRPRVIRELIERHADELAKYGLTPYRTAPIQSGKGRITEVKEAYLNERHALIIVRHSDTPNADAIYAEMIEVFLSFKKGQLKPAPAAPVIPMKPSPVRYVYKDHLAGGPLLPEYSDLLERENLCTAARERDQCAVAAVKAETALRELEARLLPLRDEANTLRAAAREATSNFLRIVDRIAAHGRHLPSGMGLFEDRLGRLRP